MGIVWILGAGFSKPLGGPLLGRMLSPESKQDLRIRYSQMPKLWSPQADAARSLYYYGQSKKPLNRSQNNVPEFIDGEGEHLWEDAEEYLDYLDTAAEKGANSPACDRLLQILQTRFGLQNLKKTVTCRGVGTFLGRSIEVIEVLLRVFPQVLSLSVDELRDIVLAAVQRLFRLPIIVERPSSVGLGTPQLRHLGIANAEILLGLGREHPPEQRAAERLAEPSAEDPHDAHWTLLPPLPALLILYLP